jgi:kynurenine formamidase
MYGGVPSHNVTDRDGAIVHDVLSVADGIHGRGVLLDVARARGVDALDPAEPIFPEHLDLAEEKEGIHVEEGDILFIRTGDAIRRKQGNWHPIAKGQPGLDATCLPWLYERGVAVLGSDGPQEVRPSGYASVYMPVHSIGIVAMGLWLIDNCDLEALADTCNEYGRWNFFVTVSALRLEGATGSPVNPIAIF